MKNGQCDTDVYYVYCVSDECHQRRVDSVTQSNHEYMYCQLILNSLKLTEAYHVHCYECCRHRMGRQSVTLTQLYCVHCYECCRHRMGRQSVTLTQLYYVHCFSHKCCHHRVE